MKDSRIGESLWFSWDGDGYRPENAEAAIYYTEGHVDLDNEIVKKALASSLQRDGLVHSLNLGFSAVEAADFSYLYIGILDSEMHPAICEESGETEYGDLLDSVVEATLVEVITE
jgi:hypothetical protein